MHKNLRNKNLRNKNNCNNQMGKKKIPQSEEDSEINSRKRKANFDSEAISNMQLQMNMTLQRLNKIEKTNLDLETRNTELEDQLDALTTMVEDNILQDDDSDDDSDDQITEEDVDKLKAIIFGPETMIEDILNSKKLSKEEYKKEYDISAEYVTLVGRKTLKPKELEYFLNLSNEAKGEVIEQEKALLSVNNNDIPPRFRILNSNLKDEIKEFIMKKISNLSEMESHSNEFNKLTQWVDGILKVPWGRCANLPVSFASNHSDINNFLSRARECMDKVIYGQNNTKDHIVEIIGKMISNPSAVGNVFAIYGPVGTGKTTIIKEGMSRALGIPFNFISLGGTSDSSYLDGHSYTYEGSVPGRIVECLKTSKCLNPIFYFDELDKVSETHRGKEIINMLIHLTDPSQNSNFQDKYYAGIPIDISKSIFVFSFNHLDAVNPILRDRMHLIKVDGFDSNDKFHISKDFLIPLLLKDYNMDENDIVFNDNIIKHIIMKSYEKEDGVRSIKRRFESIISKLNVIRLYLLDIRFPPPPTKKRRVTKEVKGKRGRKKKTNSKTVDIAVNVPTNDDVNLEKLGIKPNDVVFKNIKLKDIKFPIIVDNELVNKLISMPTSSFPSHIYI